MVKIRAGYWPKGRVVMQTW